MILNTQCTHSKASQQGLCVSKKKNGFPYSSPSVGPGADPGVQAVSPQVTISLSHPPGGRLPLLSARSAVTFPAAQYQHPWPVPSYTAW